MRKLYTLMVFVLIGLAVQAQVLITDGFEAYTANQKLAAQGAPHWTTWSNAPGGAEDPYVKTDFANGGTKSIKIEGTNDCVLLFDDKTSGRYAFSFYVYIPAGMLGYFNVLQDFAGSTSEWGMQAYFDVNGAGRVDAGGEASATFSFAYNTWIPVKEVIDLDEDFASLYINGVSVVDWVWSGGSFGTGTLNKLDAANFYAWTGAAKGTPTMYVDDVLFEQVTAPAAPTNLVANVVDNDVTLTWDAPTSGTPTGYRIFKDNIKVATVTELTYLDSDVYPGDHYYYVKADYGTDLSGSSNIANITIGGGTDRNRVTVEVGTGTWCQYCPGAAMGVDDLVANGQSVAVIEYHNGDNYTNTYSDARNAYYNITGFPTTFFDGGLNVVGGNHTTSLYPQFLPLYEQSIAIQSIYDFGMDVTYADNTGITVTIDAEQLTPQTGDLRLHLVLTESNIPESWQGMDHLNFVEREMYPDNNGTSIDFSTNASQTFTYNIDVPSTYVWENLELVAFIQENNSKMIMNSAMFPLITTGIGKDGQVKSGIAPNPVNDVFTVRANSNIRSIQVYGTNGKQVFETACDGREVILNASAWESGLYLLKIITNDGTSSQKIMVN